MPAHRYLLTYLLTYLPGVRVAEHLVPAHRAHLLASCISEIKRKEGVELHSREQQHLCMHARTVHAPCMRACTYV